MACIKREEFKQFGEEKLTAMIKKAEEEGFLVLDETDGNSPYSSLRVVIFPWAEVPARGTRIILSPVGQSYDGRGNYKNRGRTRYVYSCLPDPDGDLTIAKPTDVESVNEGPIWVRPYETHKSEEDFGGMGEALQGVLEQLKNSKEKK